MIKPTTVTLEASDVSGQKVARVRGVSTDSTVGELVNGLLGEMSLPRTSSEGRPLTYHALLEREGRHMHNSEVLGEVVRDHDRVVLQPSIEAGGC